MPTEVFLEPVPDADISITPLLHPQKQFHSSPVGPRKCMRDFPQHVRARHPDAAFERTCGSSSVVEITTEGARAEQGYRDQHLIQAVSTELLNKDFDLFDTED